MLLLLTFLFIKYRYYELSVSMDVSNYRSGEKNNENREKVIEAIIKNDCIYDFLSNVDCS